MWIVTDTTQGIWLEWRSPGTFGAVPIVTLEVPGLSFAQVELIKKQFDNMGLRPRGAAGRERDRSHVDQA
jgi:hypothetical protein